MKKEKDNQETDFINPIDKDKVAENPHLLPYAHTVGGAVIKPIDKGKIKGLAVSAMYEQTESQLEQLRKQVESLLDQAKEIHRRVDISEKIYQAEMNFKPLIGKQYHLYLRKNGKHLLSMISPQEWNGKPPYEFVETVKLMSDHTWQIIVENQ